ALLRALALSRAHAGALERREAAVGERRLRAPLPWPAAARAVLARPRPARAGGAARDRLLARRRRAGMVLRPRPGPPGEALSLQGLRLRDGLRCALSLERVGLPGDGAASAPRSESGCADLDQPSRRGHPRRPWPPILLGRLGHSAPRAAISRPRD